MGTSISFVPTTGFDYQIKNGRTSKIITHSQCITAMMVYENKSLEELRFEDYQLGRRRPKDGYGTSLYRFEPTWSSELVVRGYDHAESDGKLQSITAMKEYKHASFEELRLEDYRDGRGHKFNQFTERSQSIFGNAFQPNSQPQNETVYCNLINNLNITLPSVNFLGSPSQQRQIINAKRQLHHNFKSIKTTSANNTTLRLPFKFKSGVLNKSLDTVMSSVAHISNNNDFNVSTANTSCNDNASNVTECNDKEEVNGGFKNCVDAEIVMGNSNETMLQGRDDDVTTDLENGDCSSRVEFKNRSDKDVFKDKKNIEGGIVTLNDIESGIDNESICVDSPEITPNKLKSATYSANLENCEDIIKDITIISDPSTSYDKENSSRKIDNDTGNETQHNNVTGEIKPEANRDCKDKSCDTNTETEEGINIMNAIEESQCEDILQTSATVNGTATKEKDSKNQQFNDIYLNDLAVINTPEIEIQFDDGNRMAGNCASLDENIEASNSFNSKDISESVKVDIDFSQGLGKHDLSQSLPDNTNQNNMTEHDDEVLNDVLNNNNNNRIDKPNDVFRFDSVPKPRMIVRPSKLQNIIAFKTPNSNKSPIASGILSKTTKPSIKNKIEVSSKSIFSGYPFMNPNSTNRFNFDKSTDSDRKATLNAHLQIFSNNPKPNPETSDNNLPQATARYIRKFTPFNFQEPNTANSNVISTKTATFSIPPVKIGSSPFFRVNFAQKRTTPHPDVVNSIWGPTTLKVSETSATSISKSSSALFTSNTKKSIPPSSFLSVNTFQPFSFCSTISNTSVASTVASIKSPNLTINPATFKNTASAFTSDFGVDIINYGASTSKQFTAEKSISSRGDIAPSFKDLSVTNDTDSERMQSESDQTTMSSAELAKTLPTCLFIEDSDKANANQTSVNQSIDSQESNSQSNLLTEAKSETASFVSAFKGSSVPSSFKGKSLLKKSSMIKSSGPLITNKSELNKSSLDSLIISPQKEISLGPASGLKDTAESSTAATSSSIANQVKNPFYLGSSEDSPIKRKIVVKPLNPQFKFTNSKLTRPAFDFSKAATVSVSLSFNTTGSGANSHISFSSPKANVLDSNIISNSSALNVSPSTEIVSAPPIEQSSSQTLLSVFNNIEVLADSLTQTGAININLPSQKSQSHPVSFRIPQSAQASNVSFEIPQAPPPSEFLLQIPQSAQSSNVSFQIPESSSQLALFKNTRPVPTLSLFSDVNDIVSHNISTPPSNPTSIFNILNTESLHPLVLHREKHRYRDIIYNNGLVTNASYHPRNLYFFSAIPVIINQIFTIKVTELFNSKNNDVSIGFTAVDPCGLNVLELPADPMNLVDRSEYWVFETFKLKTNDEMKFQLKPNGDVEFYKNFRYTTSYFVDTTITLWLFIHIKSGIRIFSLKTNDRTDLSVIEAMDVPVGEININQPTIDIGAGQNDEASIESFLQNSDFWNSYNPQTGFRKPLSRTIVNNRGLNINNIQNLNEPFIGRSRPLFGTSEGQNIHPRLFNAAQDRLAINRNEICDQPISDVINRNANHTTPFSNVTEPNSRFNQSNPSRNAKHSSKPAISKLKRQDRDNECIICCDKGIDCVLYTCGHSCMCLECGISILRQGDSKCPICRKIICDVIKIYKS